MLKGSGRAAFGLFAFMAAVYLADMGFLQFRKNPTGSVTVRPYTAVPRKDKREEFLFDDPYDEGCVNSIFPHRRMPPCWYLRRHPEKRTNL